MRVTPAPSPANEIRPTTPQYRLRTETAAERAKWVDLLEAAIDEHHVGLAPREERMKAAMEGSKDTNVDKALDRVAAVGTNVPIAGVKINQLVRKEVEVFKKVSGLGKRDETVETKVFDAFHSSVKDVVENVDPSATAALKEENAELKRQLALKDKEFKRSQRELSMTARELKGIQRASGGYSRPRPQDFVVDTGEKSAREAELLERNRELEARAKSLKQRLDQIESQDQISEFDDDLLDEVALLGKRRRRRSYRDGDEGCCVVQ